MIKSHNFRLYINALAAVLWMSAGQAAFAHTRLQVPQINEGERVFNNVVIGHGCGDKTVIGSSVVFPDGVDSTILVNDVAHEGPLTDFVENWGNLNQMAITRAVFTNADEKVDASGNVVGFWFGGGEGMNAHHMALLPFRTSAALINPESCARSVTFSISIVDVCEISGTDGLVHGETANLWTPKIGTAFDYTGETDTGPASLKIQRVSALSASCGEGVDVVVKPSANQINRDMPIKINGQQVWPQP